MQKNIGGNETNNIELSDDESDCSSHDFTNDSVTIASKKGDVTDDTVLQTQQKLFENIIEPEVLPGHINIEKYVESQNSDNETSQGVEVQPGSIVTSLRDNDTQNDDYSTDKESHRLPLVVNVMNNTDQTYDKPNKAESKNNSDTSISPKDNNEE
ncbi:uncharacterized protein DI49_1546 [Saccharomyces eubayanus]|uniref:uncharacterized protein n=1 Tax=Saccharomyces eubayanus TaxID=1080349 RepID=UPI0006C188E2|nr:hypothetical protein DI49_1546 [Saccharomyces eubayanus]KOH00087.1 hypothetical protein DI49_1546 [Saccharomyces eubayanus]